MAKEIIMPALGMNQDVGVLVQWLKQEGESVTEGEPLMEVETDKSIIEIEAPGTGTLSGVIAHPGDEVPVGQAIAFILGPGEAVPAPRPFVKTTQAPRPSETPAKAAPAKPVATASAAVPVDGRILASPKARRLAAENQIDLATLKGSGPGSAVLAADVLAASERGSA